MGIQLITGPASLPITVADMRGPCSIDSSDTTWDALLTTYIASACDAVQTEIGRPLGAQVWKLALDAFPAEIDLPRGPVTAVAWVKYFDVTGTEQTLDPSLYLVDLISEPARLVPAPDKVWPATQHRANAVTVQFISGYATTPPAILQAIRATVVSWFENRDMASLPADARKALGRYNANWGFA